MTEYICLEARDLERDPKYLLKAEFKAKRLLLFLEIGAEKIPKVFQRGVRDVGT